MLYCIVALLVIILDQWTKYWVAGNIVLNTGSRELIPGLVSLVNIHNDGVAFGFLSGANVKLYLIALAGVIAVAVIILLATRVIRGELGRWSAVFVAAGGVANAIDRLLWGYVQDMFKLDFFPQFAIFNVADVFISVFAVLFILYLFFGGNKRRDEEVEFEDEDEEDRLDYEDEEEEEEEERPRRKAKKAKEPRRPARRKAKYEDEEDDFDDEEEDDEPAPRKAAARKPAAKKPEKPAPEKPVEYEQEYEAFKAARAARQQSAAKQQASARRAAPKPAPADDAFDAWDQAGGRAAAPVQKPAAPAPAPAPVQKSAPAPKASDMDFDLEDILNEFK